MKHRAFTLVELIVVIVIIGILAAILFPVFSRTNCNARRPACQSNLKQIALGVKQYIQDYDERYPPIANAKAGYWGGALQPYLKSWQIFQCPSDQSGGAPKTTDYFYNTRLAKVKEEKFDNISSTILMGDGTGNQILSYHLSQLPAAWHKDKSSPARRHVDGANYSFADGHVKWLKPEKITLDKPDKNHPTFLFE